MKAIIKYQLSESGRKASILAGGDGAEIQVIEVDRESPEFREVVELGSVGNDAVTLNFSGYGLPRFDSIQTAAEIIAAEKARRAEIAEREAEADRQRREETIAVLAERRTKARSNSIGYGETRAEYTTQYADWPIPRDKSISESPEAVAWLAELDAANETAKAAAQAEHEAKKAAVEAAKQAAAQAEQERRESLGMGEGDDDFTIENGALAQVPCWESHGRAKNWMAKISLNPNSPGGLDRDFAEKAKGDCFYILPDLSPGDAVEFGADYYTSSGKKRPERWHGYVVRVLDDRIILHECKGGKAAVREGEKFAESLAAETTPAESAAS